MFLMYQHVKLSTRFKKNGKNIYFGVDQCLQLDTVCESLFYLWNPRLVVVWVRKAAKKSFFSMAVPLSGRGMKGCSNKEKNIFKFFFCSRETFNIFWWRRHIQILILVYSTPLLCCRSEKLTVFNRFLEILVKQFFKSVSEKKFLLPLRSTRV